MIKREKDAEQLVSSHSRIQDMPERGPVERWLRAWMGISFQQPQSSLQAFYAETISGLALFWKPLWGKWLAIVLLIGCATGLCGIGLSYLVHLATLLLLGHLVGFLPPEPSDPAAQVWQENWHTAQLWLLPIIIATGGLISGFFIQWMKNPDGTEAKGLRSSDAALQAWHERVGVPIKVPMAVLFASAALVGSGGSAGLEGPSAQIGLGIGSAFADWFQLAPDERRLVQAWGMGALVAVLFHSPIGGGIFAGEILRKRGAELKVIPGALLASIVSCGLAGWSPILTWPGRASVVGPSLFWNSALLGLLCGLTGRLYASTLRWTKKAFKEVTMFPILKPTLGGLLVGLLGIVCPQVLGSGDGWLQAMINHPTIWLSIPLWIIIALPCAKLLATSLSVGSGGIGGIFGPGMIIGGLLGMAYWSVLHVLPLPTYIVAGSPALFVVVGMVALLGPIARAPVAVTLMVANLTGNISFVPAAVCALVISSWIVKEATIYPSQR